MQRSALAGEKGDRISGDGRRGGGVRLKAMPLMSGGGGRATWRNRTMRCK